MNIGEIAELFIRSAEIERNLQEHVGPGRGPGYIKAMALPYVHDFADKVGWHKERGDKLVEEPLREEQRLFWERIGRMPTAAEMSAIEKLFDWLQWVARPEERRALLAWARSKVGGKSFRRWCFTVEGIHPETGRKRKDRALDQIRRILGGSGVQNSEMGVPGELRVGPEISDDSCTFEEVGRRETLNSWASEDALTRVFATAGNDFRWADKRNRIRREREARRRKAAAEAVAA